jgi:hypothetical protein
VSESTMATQRSDDLPERWSAQRKTEFVLRGIRGEASDEVAARSVLRIARLRGHYKPRELTQRLSGMARRGSRWPCSAPSAGTCSRGTPLPTRCSRVGLADLGPASGPIGHCPDSLLEELSVARRAIHTGRHPKSFDADPDRCGLS